MMTIWNAASGLVSDLLDRLAEKVARTDTHQVAVNVTAAKYVADPDGGRAVIAKMARSEVKNYLAELAEAAELPFGDPVEFLRAIHVTVSDRNGTTEFHRDYGSEPVATCEDLGHDPRVHSPSGQAEIAREAGQ
jgi:hypothetical protein